MTTCNIHLTHRRSFASTLIMHEIDDMYDIRKGTSVRSTLMNVRAILVEMEVPALMSMEATNAAVHLDTQVRSDALHTLTKRLQ